MIKLKTLIMEDIHVKAYHGTDSKFKEFDPNFLGTKTDPGFFGWGFYFLDDKNNAKRWGKYVITVEIHLKNPLVVSGISDFIQKSGYKQLPQSISKEQHKNLYKKEIQRITKELINSGYDGVVYERSDGITQYVSFDPKTQIKILDIE